MMYFYTRDGQQHGPHADQEILAFVAQGRLRPDDLIWCEGMPAWAALHTVFKSVPPPVPQPPAIPAPVVRAAGPAQVREPPRTRVAYVLFGLFLGGLGIHNFYAGYVGRGVAQLLITLLAGWLVVPLLAVWVWCIVEVVVVTQDAKGVSFV